MKRAIVIAIGSIVVAACATKPPPRVPLCECWPDEVAGDYDSVTKRWTRDGSLRGEYQEVLDLSAVFMSPEWRAIHAAREAKQRGLVGEQREQLFANAKKAALADPFEVELLVTTWDRKENDLDRGKRSVWHVVLVDEQGKEIEPLEIVKDKRPQFTLRSQFPAFGDFATAYIARFPRVPGVLGPNVRKLALRMSSERGAVELIWAAP
jgi:hypothetical protein